MSILILPETVDDCLLDTLAPRELLRYSRTCKTAHHIVQDYMKRVFRVDRLLCRYFTSEEILHFRKLQYLTGALISGSTAVEFFDRTMYPGSELDVYVELKFARTVADWLVEIGYKYTSLSKSADMATLDAALTSKSPVREHAMPPITVVATQDCIKPSLILNFEKKRPRRTIKLNASLTCPVHCILDSHSTCVMNVLAHDKAYSFFPKGTFEERRSMLRHRAGDADRDLAVQQYLRGWSIFDPSTISIALQLQDPAFPLGPRYVGDHMCWTLHVHPVLELPPGLVEANSWFMTMSADIIPTLVPLVMASPELKLRYTLSPNEVNIVKDRIWPHVLSLKKATGGTSDSDYDYLGALKKHRNGENENAQNPGGHSPFNVILENAFTLASLAI